MGAAQRHRFICSRSISSTADHRRRNGASSSAIICLSGRFGPAGRCCAWSVGVSPDCGSVASKKSPGPVTVDEEINHFEDHLTQVRGLGPVTCRLRRQRFRAFLLQGFATGHNPSTPFSPITSFGVRGGGNQPSRWLPPMNVTRPCLPVYQMIR